MNLFTAWLLHISDITDQNGCRKYVISCSALSFDWNEGVWAKEVEGGNFILARCVFHRNKELKNLVKDPSRYISIPIYYLIRASPLHCPNTWGSMLSNT